jgi:hypothetical protein
MALRHLLEVMVKILLLLDLRHLEEVVEQHQDFLLRHQATGGLVVEEELGQ